MGGIEKLKEHEFFKSITWSNLSEQQPPNPTTNVTQTAAQADDNNVNNF